MIGFSLPLEWPADGRKRAEMERVILEMVATRVQAPAEVDRRTARDIGMAERSAKARASLLAAATTPR